MKKDKIGLIGILVIMAVGLSGYMMYALSTNRGGYYGNSRNHNVITGVQSVNLVNTQEIDMSGIEEIMISYDDTSMDIDFYKGDSDKMIIKEYMFDGVTDDNFAIITTNNISGKVKVESGRKHYTVMIFGIMYGSERVEVYLPKDYHGQIQAATSSGNVSCTHDMELSGDFKIKTSSGDIKLKEVSAASISLTTSSGNIRMDKADGNRTFTASSGDIVILGGKGDSSASTSSGTIDISNIEGSFKASSSSGDITLIDVVGNGRIGTTSGVIRLKNMTGNVEDAKSSSGDIMISNLTGAVDAQSTSGGINIKFNEVTGNITASASSGDVRISMPKDRAFSFTANTSSGDIYTWFDGSLRYNKRGNEAEGIVGNSPEFDVRISTTSGNVNMVGN